MMEGVTLHPLKHIIVPKGDIYHAMKSTDEGYAGFGEAYFSQIAHGEVKGWKRHNRMTLNLIVPVGKVRFVIYDDREDSLTRGQFQEVVLSPESNYQRLTVVPGLWMAFYGEGEGMSMLMDIIPEPHDPLEASRMDLSEIAYNF
ncbi:dTDP-4-dehydrorhamnose 3,5-epimerase [Phocaeicola sp.]